MTLARLQTILTERETDPLGIGHSNIATPAGDDAYLSSINGLTRSAPVPVVDVISHLISISTYVAITESANESAKNFTKRLDITIFQTVDMKDANVVRDIDGIVTAAILTALQKTALVALEDNLQSRATELGVGTVKQRDLGRTRVELGKGLIS